MLRITLLSALLAVALCAHHKGDGHCDHLAREKVKQQWSVAYHHNRHDVGQAIWRAAFSENSAMRDYFSRVHGEDTENPAFVAHSMRVLGGLDMLISISCHDDILQAALAHLKEQHDARHISDEAWETFKHALMHAVPAIIGRCFDETAWSDCFDLMRSGITGH